jgi:uncharacterized peroxidase-related enzyme
VQAHANDLRSEIEQDWRSILGSDGSPAQSSDELDALVHQLARDWSAATLRPDAVAMLNYAERVTRTPAECSRDDVDALRAAGWSDAAIHDAVQVIAYFNYINRIADALGVELERELPTWGAEA